MFAQCQLDLSQPHVHFANQKALPDKAIVSFIITITIIITVVSAIIEEAYIV